MEPSASDESSAGSFALGLLFVLTGAAVMGLAQQVPSATLGETHDPGPRAFPLGLGFLLFLGGVWESILAWRSGRKPADEVVDSSGKWVAPVLVLGLGIYTAVMPWAGFVVSTLLFAMLVMRYLGIRWRTACGASLLLTGSILLLFVKLFKVPLPAGFLGMI